ncbi:glutamate/aspartate ABC transporter substrate-binding protein [soil metagenome]
MVNNNVRSIVMKAMVALGMAALLPLAAAQGTAAADSGTLRKLRETGVITLGVRDASIPMSYLDNKQQYVGFHIDICNRIVDEIRKQAQLPTLKVHQQLVTSANRIPLITNGTIDMECGSTTNTSERQKQVAFALTTFVTDIRVMVKATSGVKSIADLNGKTVAVTTGTTTVPLIKAQERGRNIQITEVNGRDHAESFLLLETNRAAAFALDDYLLAGARSRSKDPAAYLFLPEVLRTEPIAIMLRKDDPAFKKIADDTIRAMMKSGEFEKLYNKWFMGNIPDVTAPLSMPLSGTLKTLIANPTDAGV